MFKTTLLAIIFLNFSLLFSEEKVLDQKSSRYLELTVIHSQNHPVENDHLIFRFQVRPIYHINSGSPMIEGLIPTTVSLKAIDDKPINISLEYPPAEILNLSGFKTTVYFGGPHDILVTPLLPTRTEGWSGEKINYAFHYQACKDDECYAPEEIQGDILLPTHERLWSEFWQAELFSIFTMDILWVLAFAFLGGMILNITPCVLPILSLKLISFSMMKNIEKSTKKKYAAFHILGAVTFFLMIAAGVIFLKAGGEQIGWGFQFQNPHYIFFITVVLTVVALNLLGVFEIPFSYTTNSLEKKPSGQLEENLKHFGTGFLSVILATPCTAPFLGIAAAYSFSQGASIILLLHLFTALGFITPYTLIFFGVDISRLIPQLQTARKYIKKVLGFIIILTLIWLVDIYWTLTQEGIPLLGALWITALGLWAYGEIQIRNPYRAWQWKFWSIALVIWGVFIFWLPDTAEPIVQTTGIETQESGQEEVSTTSSGTTSSGLVWEQFSKARLEEYQREDSKIVYVHFTADWCLNCKVNEKLILESDAVVSLLKQYQVVMIKADWTRPNQNIFNEIQSLGRAGIPLDVIYRGNNRKILNSILTTGEIETILKEISL